MTTIHGTKHNDNDTWQWVKGDFWRPIDPLLPIKPLPPIDPGPLVGAPKEHQLCSRMIGIESGKGAYCRNT